MKDWSHAATADHWAGDSRPGQRPQPLLPSSRQPRSPPSKSTTKNTISIAVEPYDNKQKESIFRVDYLGHGIMPVRLIVTNNGDRPISLRDARILFYTRSGDRIQAAGPEDVERLMTRNEREGKKIPMPGPIPIHQDEAQGQQ